MITWKDEGERSVAYIRGARCGSVGPRRWSSCAVNLEALPFDWQAIDCGPYAVGSLEIAKSALEAAMSDFCARAGLVALSVEPSEEMVEKMAMSLAIADSYGLHADS